jgi:hypothetical protein
VTERELRIQQTAQECKHFVGVQHALCGAGVHLRTLVGGPDLGWALRIPCFARNADAPLCNLRELPSQEEAERSEDEHEATLQKFSIAHKAAKADAKSKGLRMGHGGASRMPCPSGCDGELRYSVASCNGHMHAACTTKGCISWME